MRTGARILCSLAAATLAFAGTAQAQTNTGSITGTVTDTSGAAIKGASVSVINTDRNHTERVLTTNDAGMFIAQSLPEGTYTVVETSNGFKKVEVKGLILHVNDNLTVNRSLPAGGAGETVTVEADALMPQLQDATATGLITGNQARELVLSTRNFEQLMTLQAGVAYTGVQDQIYVGPSSPFGTVTTLSFSVNGQRTSANNWTVDGADNVDRGSNLTLLVYPSIDAISEFKTQRGVYSAAFGRSAAGQINLVTKAGTNQFHGGVFEFFRNNILNANDWANKNVNPGTAPVKRTPFRYHDFGGTIGGPIWKDKTFFFFSEEVRRVIKYTPSVLYVPTANERHGIFLTSVCQGVSSAGTCPNAGTTTITTIDPAAAAYIKDIYSADGSKVPLPNPNGTQDLHAYNYNGRSVYNDAQELVRIDQDFGTKWNLFYRFIHDSIPTQEPFGFGGGTGLPGVQVTNTKSPGTQHVGHVTYVPSPSLVVNVGYAYSAGSIVSTPAGTGSSANSPDINIPLPYPSYLGVVPNLTFTSLTGLSQGGGYNDYSRNHNAYGDILKTFGRHTIGAGVTYNHYEKTENLQGGNVGTFSFTASNTQLPAGALTSCGTLCGDVLYSQSWANFLSGVATGGFTQTGQPRIPDLKSNSFEVYVQDDWKATPRLTVNFGLRYSLFALPTDSNGWMSNFDASTYVAANAPTVDNKGTLCLSGHPCNTGYTPNPTYDPSNGYIYVNPGRLGVTGHQSRFGDKVGASDRNNLAPRFGFAYDVFGNGKTALRGGFGLAFDDVLIGDYEYNAFYAQPALGGSSYPYTSFDTPATGTATAPAIAGVPSPLYNTATQFHTPYSEQFSLDLQQVLMPSLLLDIGYYGAHDTHLIGYTDINALAPGQAAAAGILPAGGFASSAGTLLANQIRRYKGYGGMYSVQPIYNSNYNSLQLSVKKQLKGKSEISGNFTWQRNLSNGPTGDRSSAPQDFTNIKAEYGRAAYDRNTFGSIDFIYELPWYRDQKGLVGRVVGGWEVSMIVALDSGLPMTVTGSQGASTYPNGTSAGGVVSTVLGPAFNDVAGLAISGSSPASLRPDMVGDPNGGLLKKNRYHWFNTNAFSSPLAALGQPGNSRRGVITGPGINREDLGLFRNFRIVNNVVFQLRGEAFNVLNHTNYNTIGTTITSNTFGQATAARETRILQVAGKITF